MVDVLEYRAYGEALGDAGAVLRANAAAAGMHAAVPTCPGWTVLDLVVHQGVAHRWGTSHVRGEQPRPDHEVDREGRAAPDPLDWLDEGLVELLNALASAPADLDAWFFLHDAPAPRVAWARREAHETTIHAADAMGARLGRAPYASELWVSADFACDGIDELLTGFLPRRQYALTSARPERVLVTPDDSSRSWIVDILPEGTTTTRLDRSVVDADVILRGTARQLYLGLWNRGSEVEVHGRRTWLEIWRERVRVTWG